jgi:nitrogen fixation protein FixH
MHANSDAKRKRPRELTGRMVLLWLVAFFGVVFAVNGVLVRAAISTFGGVETASSYKAGLQFEQDVATAQRQDALHWQVSGNLTRDGAGVAVLDVIARDANGAPLAGLSADAWLAHPADERLDHVIPVRSVSGGVFHGSAEAQPGQWELIVDLFRGGDRLFRSRSRVTLR